MNNKITIRTGMNTDNQIFGYGITASGAALRSAVGVNFNECSTSPFCLVGQKVKEHSPSCITDTLSQVVILDHVSDLQIFNGYKSVVVDYLTGKFMSKVFSLVSDFKMLSGKKFNRFLTVFATPLFTGYLTLGNTEFSKGFLEIMRTFYKLIIRSYSKGFNTHVYAKFFIRFRKRLNTNNITKTDIPLITILFNRNGSNISIQKPVHTNFNKPYIQDIKSIIFNLYTITISRISDRIKSISALKSWESSVATIKRLKGFIQTSKHILSSTTIKLCYFWYRLAEFFKFTSLVIIIQRFMLRTIGIFTFCEGGVINISSRIKYFREFAILLFIGIKTINKRFSHNQCFVNIGFGLPRLRFFQYPEFVNSSFNNLYKLLSYVILRISSLNLSKSMRVLDFISLLYYNNISMSNIQKGGGTAIPLFA